jgi:hypothetical protein
MQKSCDLKTDPTAFNETKDLRDVAVSGLGICPSFCGGDIIGDKSSCDMAPGESEGV